MDIKELRKGVEGFAGEMDEEYYLNGSGQKEDLNLSAIYEKYSYLFSEELLRELTEAREEASGEEDRSLRFFQAFVTEALLDSEVTELNDRFETAESKASIEVDGEKIAYRMSAVTLSNEENREKRKEIDRKRLEVVKELNPILEAKIAKLHKTARGLGYENYMALYRSLKGIDFINLEKIMKNLLVRTEGIYVEKMDEFLRENLGITLEEAEKHDMSLLFRAKEFDGYFPKEKLIDTFKATLKGMGIDLDSQKNIHLDYEERPSKSPRAFVAPIKVPEKIMLNLLPHGGYGDYDTLLHEGGHAEHFASVDPALPEEFKYLGDISVSESYAFLFQYLTTDARWVARYTDMEDMEKYLDFVYLIKLFFLRRYAAKLIYEIKLHQSIVDDSMGKVYKETLESALKFRHPEEHYLVDVDDGFYVSQYLRAWIFEAQLRAALMEKFGEKWFENPEAGPYLMKNLYSYGQKYNVEELAVMLGYQGLDAEPLIEEIEDHFD